MLRWQLAVIDFRNSKITDTKITDDAVKSLARIAQLESLDLSRTKMTAAGIAECQAALPNCRIRR